MVKNSFAKVVLLCLATTAMCCANTFYVSLTGRDSNNGTKTAPFRHLSKAAAAAKSPGDEAIVMDGTYDNEGVVAPNFVVTLTHSGAPGHPITFMAMNRGRTILDAMNTSPTTACNGAASYFNLRNASYIVIQGFVLQHSCDSGIQSNDTAHDIEFRWNEFKEIANHTVTDQYGRDGIYLNQREYNFTFDGNVFHDIGRTDGQANLHFDHGLYFRSRNVTVINNVFYHINRGFPIQLADGASDALIANNTFAFGAANGEDGQIIFWERNTNIAIQNNIFYKPNGAALNRFHATIVGCTFDHNLIYGTKKVMTGGTAGIVVGANRFGLDPRFVNASAEPYDFHVGSGSPAIGGGVALAQISRDLEGRARAMRPLFDLGAYMPGD
jgi:hypothetical protein